MSPQSQSSAEAWQPGTRAIALGRPEQVDYPLNTPIMPATSYLAGESAGYSRVGNPSWESFEAIVGSLEHGQAISFGSGMAAISATFAALGYRKATGVLRIATPTMHYSGSRGLLRGWQRRGQAQWLRYDPHDLSKIADIAAQSDVLLLESPANPTMVITDLAAAVAAIRQLPTDQQPFIVADNTYATPLSTQPLELGVDVVVHSASKYFAGHSDALLGVAVTKQAELAQLIAHERTAAGAVPGVLEAWLGTRGMRTFPLRFKAASANAFQLAQSLAGHPEILWVRYPHLTSDPGFQVASKQMAYGGAVVTFAARGGADRADRLIAAGQLWSHATSLGGVESTFERRSRHDDESTRTPVDLIRLSVGCEDVADLWEDLNQALAASAL